MFRTTAVCLGFRNVSSQLMILVWTWELKCFLKYYIKPDSIQWDADFEAVNPLNFGLWQQTSNSRIALLSPNYLRYSELLFKTFRWKWSFLAVWVLIVVSTCRNYARNDNCSPCRRKHGAVLKKETCISVLWLRKYKESSMDRLWRKCLTVTHKECVHYFSREKGGNMPKWAVCFFPFIFSNPPQEPDGVSAQRPERLWVFCFAGCLWLVLGSRVLYFNPEKVASCFMNLSTFC